MKKILGLDLGTTSIGWAVVNEAETEQEQSSIVRAGVRVNPLTTDEQTNFEKGKPITTNAERTQKRSMRRHLQRYRQRRDCLVEKLKEVQWISRETILSERGNDSTFQTYRLRAKAAVEPVTLEELARVLLMINKKRGYKSSRKSKSSEEGALIDGMEIAKKLYDDNLTPGQFGDDWLNRQGKHYISDFYRSDLQKELERIWQFQQSFHADLLTDDMFDTVLKLNKDRIKKTFFASHHIEALEIKGRGIERTKQVYRLRAESLQRQLTPEELVFVIAEVVGQKNNSSGYLGAISDRSKELYFKRQTVGQYLMDCLDANPHVSLKNKPFYRQDYLDEFETVWETQRQYHPEMTDELKSCIRDVIIFYQRPLKSQKWLVSFCEFEPQRKVCPKSSPVFQEFRILQNINHIKIKQADVERPLSQEERALLLKELTYTDKLGKKQILDLLFDKKVARNTEINFDTIEGNRTMASILKAISTIIEMSGNGEYDFSKLSATDTLYTIETIFKGLGFDCSWLCFDSSRKGPELDREPLYRLWHLLYSFEGDNSNTGDEKLVNHLSELLHLPLDYAKVLAKVTFEQDYGSLSVKALQNILPFLHQGAKYNEACQSAGYRHSASSLTREELDSRPLQDHLTLLPKNSLRNPVVEKILNQMINVVNGVIDTCGRPDEVRIELARELKKSAAERESMKKALDTNTKEMKILREQLQKDFGNQYGSRNDIIRYKLYRELESNGYRTLYSNQYIPYEKLFSKEIDIEHIIPQSRLFDDSFSNKTLEYKDVNIRKGNATAMDYVRSVFDEEGVNQYLARIDDLVKKGAISRTKAKNLKTTERDIPDDFINRDLRDSQYISRKAQELLRQVVREVHSTTGSITDRLREDWQIVEVMQELNWDKYAQRGLTCEIEGRDGQKVRHIQDWTKRNDHRHHAMDAITIAFTKPVFVQYLNNLNAHNDKDSIIYAIQQKELERIDGKWRFRAPIQPISAFRAEVKSQLESILVSIKAKNKVVTRNVNTTKTHQTPSGKRQVVQLTPRGSLHKETVCALMKVPSTRQVTVGPKLTEEIILLVKSPLHRDALLRRLHEFEDNPKLAFSGRNSLDKKPVWLNESHTRALPARVTIETFEEVYTVRKPIDKNLNLDKVVDDHIRAILQARLERYDNKAELAFSNLDNDPIYLNQDKGITIRSVRCKALNNAEALHSKHDKEGNPILDANGNPIPADYVSTGSNHHVAIFEDSEGNLQEHIVSFYEATCCARLQLPIVDKDYNHSLGWKFLFTLKQNEYFVFPNPATGFDPTQIDLTDPHNYPLISPNLFRVQKMSSKYYVFRHHLETNVEDTPSLREITWKRIHNTNGLKGIVKVRVNHLGQIVQVGEY